MSSCSVSFKIEDSLVRWHTPILFKVPQCFLEIFDRRVIYFREKRGHGETEMTAVHVSEILNAFVVVVYRGFVRFQVMN